MTDTSASHQAHTRNWFRLFANPVTWIVFFGCAPLVAARLPALFHLNRSSDFALYWTAGRLFLAGQNPYSASSMLALEVSLGWSYVHPLMFCPPWVLPFAAFAALFPIYDARMTWVALSFLLDCLSSVALWMYFGGERNRAWIAVVIAITFCPMAAAEYLGQITPLVLASFVIFLFLIRRRNDYAAGVMLLGLGLKPHLLYLVLLAVVLWTIQYRRWKLIAGAVTSFSAAILAVLFYNHQTVNYFHNTWGPATEVLTGIGGVLRGLFGAQHVWLQFLPSAMGILWFIVYWRRNHNEWDWREHLPLLVLVSLCSAPYFWFHDFILAMPALVFIAVESKQRLPILVPAWLLIQCLILPAGQVSAAFQGAAGVLWIAFYFYARRQHARYAVPTLVMENGGAL